MLKQRRANEERHVEVHALRHVAALEGGQLFLEAPAYGFRAARSIEHSQWRKVEPVQHELPRRRRLRPLYGTHGTLCGRVEEAQAFDLPAEQLHSHRKVRRWREEVNNAAPVGHLPRLRYDRLDIVSCSDELPDKGIDVHGNAGLQRRRRVLQI